MTQHYKTEAKKWDDWAESVITHLDRGQSLSGQERAAEERRHRKSLRKQWDRYVKEILAADKNRKSGNNGTQGPEDCNGGKCDFQNKSSSESTSSNFKLSFFGYLYRMFLEFYNTLRLKMLKNRS